MSQKTTPAIVAASILVLVATLIYYRGTPEIGSQGPISRTSRSCSALSEGDLEARTAAIDGASQSYATSSRRLMGLSTEGGEQVDYTDANGNTLLVRQTLYGETFKSEVAFYLSNKHAFYLRVIRLEYEKPIAVSIEETPVIAKTTVRQFYLNEGGEVCKWYLDDRAQQNDPGTQEFVSFLLSMLSKKN